MKKVAIIYHSAHGHTEFIAEQILAGIAAIPSIQGDLLHAPALLKKTDVLLEYDGFILGSPTYFGGVSAPFKAFMDATGPLWRHQRLRGRLAAGFSVSSLASGDKQSTLMSLFVFAMQHGLIWVGNPILPEQLNGIPEDEAANRLGSWSGLMAQAEKASPGHAFVPGDIKAAQLFGTTFAHTLLRMQDTADHKGEEVA
ncbi:flavodoxin family protein [Pseudomonas sp. GOM6]|uniref:flavodoxin family protein n=1 Tax=Pseudomonas sp. GOM6 TaxID=3036944 RepID=UPI00240A0ED4|nr:flavodoxin family protein [Pseudomonas sp. GOM6]MDG1581751.1 flavodoxin family protein [Pseudomonas sp. GOM6]